MSTYVNHILGQTPSPELYSSFDSNLQLDGYYSPLVSQGQYNTQTGELVSSPKKFGSNAYKSPYGAVNTLRYAAFTNTADTTPNYLYFDAWIYIDGLQYGDYEIFSLCNGATDQNYKSAFGVTAARKVFFNTRPANSTSLHLFSGNTTMNAFQWYHIAVKYENLKKTLYVNGVKDGEYSYASATGLESFLWTPHLSGGGVVLDVISAHIGTSSADLPTDAQILARAQYSEAVNVTISETPAIAVDAVIVQPSLVPTYNIDFNTSPSVNLALMTEPTIVIVNYDTTQISTSILVNAIFPMPGVESSENSNENVLSFDANVEFLDPTIVAGVGVTKTASRFEAFAEAIQEEFAGSNDAPTYAEVMTASAVAVYPMEVFFPENYRHLVKGKTPSLYLNDFSSYTYENNDLQVDNDGYDNWGQADFELYTGVNALSVEPAGFPMNSQGNGLAVKPTGIGSPRWGFFDEDANNRAIYFVNDYNNYTFEIWLKPLSNNAYMEWDFGYVEARIAAAEDRFATLELNNRAGSPLYTWRRRSSGVSGNYLAIETYDSIYPGYFTMTFNTFNTSNGNWEQVRTIDWLTMTPGHPRYVDTIFRGSTPTYLWNPTTDTWRLGTSPAVTGEIAVPGWSSAAAPTNSFGFDMTLKTTTDTGANNFIQTAGEASQLQFTGGDSGQNHFEWSMFGDEVANDSNDGNYVHTYKKTIGSTGIVESPFRFNEWNHVVYTLQYGNYSTSVNLRGYLWINGSLVSSRSDKYVNPVTPNINQTIGIPEVIGLMMETSQNMMFNQFALYKKILNNGEILENYNFIANASPNRIIEASPLIAIVYWNGGNFYTVENVTFPATPIEANAIANSPSVSAGAFYFATPSAVTASAQLVNPAFYGDPDVNYLHTAFSANAYAPENVFHLDSKYFEHVINNHSPHRYVTFDSPDSYLDFGLDNDYTNAAPFSINGYINLPYQGLNNNSLVTNNNDIYNAGLVIKESEYNDDWGTDVLDGTGYHFSFWLKKNITDTISASRIICNAQSYLYPQDWFAIWQQGNTIKLTMQSTGGGVQTYTSTSTVNVFDGIRHHVVANFYYPNNGTSNGVVKIYVDRILILTANVNNCKPVLKNATSYVDPDSETNNKARFAICGAITTDIYNKLQVVVYPSVAQVDEFYWSKTLITAQQVEDLYFALPGRQDIEIIPDAMLSIDCKIQSPTLGTGYGKNALPALATAADIPTPVAGADRALTYSVNETLTASAEIIEPVVVADSINNILIIADLLVAGADIVSGAYKFSVPAQAMTATATFPQETPYFDPFELLVLQQSIMDFDSSYGTYGGYTTGDLDS